MAKQQLYYIYKINTSRLKEENYNITDYTPSKARLNEELISVGDNQIFYFIRQIRNIIIDFEKLKKLYSERDKIKYLPSSKENSEVIRGKQQLIDVIILMEDIINVKVDDKQSYKYICKNSFFVNNKKFIRLCSGAGQMRRSTVSFVSEDIYNQLNTILMNGLKFKQINLSKFNAYYGLYMSSITKVRTPRVCLINDCELQLLNKKIDWVIDKKTTDVNGKEYEYRDIEEKNIDLLMNVADGQGLIDPNFALDWQKDLELDYIPCQFTVRSSFIKGMVTSFDFKKFAHEVVHTDIITDYYGKDWDINDIDILISISQFKMYKYYKSWQEYIDNCEKYGHIWGIAKVNKRYDDEYSLLNYQYVQTLNLNEDKIKQLAKPTIDWVNEICSGDKLYTLLFLLGVAKDDSKLNDILEKTKGNDWVKVIIYNDKLLQDDYIQNKIYKSIEKRINEAKIGRLWDTSNYQVMVADPYIQCEKAFGLKPKGLLKEFEHYSSFWNKRNIKIAMGARSPMVDFSEWNTLNFIQNKMTEKWYQYLYSGIIYSGFGLDTIIHSDSDYDADIVYTTSNSIIRDNKFLNRNPITYEKTKAPEQKMNKGNLLKTDLKGFECTVGQTTNFSTSFIAMLPKFKNDEKSYNELITRIKTLRRYIGDSIDKAKGIKTKSFPQIWKRRKKINDNDSEETKQIKYYYNNLVGNKKPYFMIHIYPKLMEEYKKYKKDKGIPCREIFGCSLKELIHKKNKTEEEKKFIRKYFYFMPVLTTNCIINQLCWMIEHIDFNLKYKRNEKYNQDTVDILINKDILKNEERFIKIEELYNKFKKQYYYKSRRNKVNADDNDIEEEKENDKLTEFCNEIRNEAYEICSNKQELANYAVEICYKDNVKTQKEFVWNIAIEGILENVIKNKSDIITIPIKDDNGVEYLGKKYSLGRVIE